MCAAGLVMLCALTYPSPRVLAQNSTPAGPRLPVALPLAELKADATLPIALEPGAIATDDAIWIPQRASGTAIRVDPKNNAPQQPVAIGSPICASLLSAFDSVWSASCGSSTIHRFHPVSGNVTASAPLPVADPATRLVAAAKSVWVATDRKGVISRIDPASDAAVAEVFVPANPAGLAASDDVVWVTSEEGDVLTRIDAHTNLVTDTVKVGRRPGPIAIGEGAVWVLNRGDGSVSRVDQKTHKVIATIRVGEGAIDGDIAAGEGAVWVSARGMPIIRIDPRTNRVTQRFTGDGGGAIVVGHGSVWVAAGANTTWRVDPKLIAAIRN
jgi:virginiamycin B lyase